MSDIVETLNRRALAGDEACDLAAAEIERLRAALEGVAHIIDTLQSACQSALEQRFPPGDKAEALRVAIGRAQSWKSSARLNSWVQREIAEARVALKANAPETTS